MPNAILEVMVLTMGKVLCVAHGHLLTTVPGQFYGFPELISNWSFVASFPQ